MDYNQLLDRAQKSMPESVHEKGRFEIPKVIGHIEGNKTIISNFFQIASHMHRDPDHMLKYVLKGLATPGVFSGNKLVFGTKISASRLYDKIKQYADEYFFCPDCGKPDTQLARDGKVLIMKCAACGSKHTVKG